MGGERLATKPFLPLTGDDSRLEPLHDDGRSLLYYYVVSSEYHVTIDMDAFQNHGKQMVPAERASRRSSVRLPVTVALAMAIALWLA